MAADFDSSGQIIRPHLQANHPKNQHHLKYVLTIGCIHASQPAHEVSKGDRQPETTPTFQDIARVATHDPLTPGSSPTRRIYILIY
jgi:hypothetical protein